ncbi:S1C family serine protease [Muricoccus radiodurans]|uniref:S1C family serine protease n=1 Tax=Muricoccus radiodurans TaxID=2231721 RepID=UPI003CEA2830
MRTSSKLLVVPALALPVLLMMPPGGSPALAQLVPGKPGVLGPSGPAPAAPGLAGKPPPLGVEAPPQQVRPGPGPGQPRPPQQASAGKPPPLGPNEGPQPGGGGGGGGGREVSSGTGFMVTERQVMTNDHVIRECRSIRARNSEGREIVATVRARDQQRDLALLDLRDRGGPPVTFRSTPEVRRGEAIVTYGFPLSGLLSSGPTLTTGDISALAGLADNAQQFQISAPVQPGNSGGPLLDGSGHVVGIITSKLNAQRVAQRTGDIPQNVNFAVKGSEALDFLRRNGVQPRVAESTATRTPAEVGETVHPSVLFLRCFG